MLFYNHYTVIGSKIKVTFLNTVDDTPGADNICTVGIGLKAATTAISTDFMDEIENKYTHWKTLGPTNGNHG